eukprot:TRINITY_DN6473_c0_g1_i1.p1 TRINITY_DN6473_c0_g1~~TRINITY_DN6473_c0_g1_i1.p1  ORF type:complete len:183 (+),score=51.95 TRINITY_DN6473_c0_g1_i1:71-619(+)
MKKVPVGIQEEPMKKNMVSTLASNLQDLSLEFRKAQKDYLERLRARQTKGKLAFSIEEDEMNEEGALSVSFNQNQLAKVNESEEMIIQRTNEIREIAKSITELASIFKDLSTMVIEQGTILDNIAYNVEEIDHNIVEVVQNVTEAKKYQASYRNKLCMLLLCLAIFLMILVVIVMGTTKKKS